MKPTAKKYRLQRQTSARRVPQGQGGEAAPDQAPAPTSATVSDAPASPVTQSTSDDNLSPRQLRIARRLAQKYGMEPNSDLDAVRLLRAKGIDPFHNTNVVGLAVTEPKKDAEGDGEVKLPQKHNQKIDLPAQEVISAERRASEIRRIQRDIARRRRIKLSLLLTRLAVFVLLPTIVAGYYFYSVATPMYATKSEFLILNAEGGSTGGRMGGLIPSQFATGQDSIATQSYLESKDAMLRLDRDHGFRNAFNQDWIDPIQRLDPDASNETVYKLYKKYVKLGYDQSEGVIRMEVSSPDPTLSMIFSQALIDYAEERVDQLSQEKREDAVKTGKESLEDAKMERRAAQEKLVALQESTLLDPEGEIANIRALIGAAETQLQEKQVALRSQLQNKSPNQARVDALNSEIEVLQATLDKQNKRMNEAQNGAQSLAAKTAEIHMAEADLATADMIMQSALESLRQTETEANRQVRYMTVSVDPIPSQDPSYPRSFENTLLAFLIFAGIYLMLSLTASILREQVSS